jgi:hypothetical protein
MMSILNNVTKQPPDHIKNTVVEIKLKIDAWIIPMPYIVAPDCIFTMVVRSTSASIAINTLKATCCAPDQIRPDQTISGNGPCIRYNGISQSTVNITFVGNSNQTRPGTIFQTRETRQFTTS